MDEDEYRRWHRDLARNSVATADDYRRKLAKFLHENKLTPTDYAKLPPRQCFNILSDHIDKLMTTPSERTGRPVAGSGCSLIKKAVVSWLAWNENKLSRNLKIPHVNHRPTLRGVTVPVPTQLGQVLRAGDARARAGLSLIALAGLREGVMGDYEGQIGLCIRDLVDAEIKDGIVVFTRTPCRIVVSTLLSKMSNEYFSFLGPEGCSYLDAYFRQRAKRGEVLTPDSPVIRSSLKGGKFLRTPSIYRILREPMLIAGVKAMPYIWRSYFDTRAMLAEGKGLNRDYRQFFMGHAGDIEHVYTLHKDLSADVIDDMRKGYELILPFLETIVRPDPKNPMVRITEAMLKAAGQPDGTLAKMDLSKLDEPELIQMLTLEVAKRVQAMGPIAESTAPAESLAEAAPNVPTTASPAVQPLAPVDAAVRQPRTRQKVVAASDLNTMLEQGWLFLANLAGDKAVVELVA